MRTAHRFRRRPASIFGFLDAFGRAQTAGCVKALRKLERAGHFTLPAVIEVGPRQGQDRPAS